MDCLRLLVRHFFGRFFDNESVSQNGDMRTNVVQAFGLVATPGIMVPFYMLPQRARFDHPFAYNWVLLGDYYFFVMFSMVVMGFVMVFEWDALFPDRKDYLILTPLPLGGGSIFAGKTLALVLFLGLFAVDANLFCTLLALLVIGGEGTPAPVVWRLIAIHAASVVGAGTFVALSIASVQGVLINPYVALNGLCFRRDCRYAQGVNGRVLGLGMIVLAWGTPIPAQGQRASIDAALHTSEKPYAQATVEATDSAKPGQELVDIGVVSQGATAVAVAAQNVKPTDVAAQAEPDPTAIVGRMAENLERDSFARQQYVYEMSVSTALWTSGARASQHESRKYVVSGSYGPRMRVNAFQGECRSRGQVYPYTMPGFRCPGLVDFASLADGLRDDLLDEGKSPDAVPYWLLPLRPAYLKYFRFIWNREAVYNGQRVYTIDFEPARGVFFRLPPDDLHRDARAWKGTLWVDADEAQLARLDVIRLVPARGLFKHASFQIDYERVAKDVWFPVRYCNVLWGGNLGARVSFESCDFRKVDVSSQMEYVFSTIQYH